MKYGCFVGPRTGNGTLEHLNPRGGGTGLRFVNWEHHHHRDAARAELRAEAAAAPTGVSSTGWFSLPDAPKKGLPRDSWDKC